MPISLALVKGNPVPRRQRPQVRRWGLFDQTNYADPDLTPWHLAASCGHGWVRLWNYLIDNSVDFSDQVMAAPDHLRGRTAVDIIRMCMIRNLDFNDCGGILTPTATVAVCLIRYLDKVFGVTLSRSVIRCILDHYRGSVSRV